MWLVVEGKGSDPPYRIYDFRENRQYKHVSDILGEYRGILHSEKYGAYQELAEKKQIIWSPCFAHIRRKLLDAKSCDPRFREWVKKANLGAILQI